MAKWGEGDPRWICEERPDATNVNNWHWTEKNASPWSKQRLPELLTGFTVEDGPVKFSFTDISKLDGEATANNRKSKLIFLFEWEVWVKFIATVEDSDLEYKGYIAIPNLSDENEAHEVDVEINIDTKGPHEALLRSAMHSAGTKKIQERVAVYLRELKEEFSKGLILPTEKPKEQVISKGNTRIFDKKVFQNQVVSTAGTASSSAAKPTLTGSGKMVSKSLAETFKCRPEELFDILTKKDKIDRWTSGSAICQDFGPGGAFSMFNQNLAGFWEEHVPNKEVKMRIRTKTFPPEHHAHAVIHLVDQGDGTKLKLELEGIPEECLDETKNNFKRFYLQSIARTYGFGMRPF